MPGFCVDATAVEFFSFILFYIPLNIGFKRVPHRTVCSFTVSVVLLRLLN